VDQAIETTSHVGFDTKTPTALPKVTQQSVLFKCVVVCFKCDKYYKEFRIMVTEESE
jgi:hypothetical protein